MPQDKPVVVITGAAGNIGRRLRKALSRRYRVIGLDRPDGAERDETMIGFDLTDSASVERAIDELRQTVGEHIASVIHLAAYFDFSGEERPQYKSVNEDGTRNLLRALQKLDVTQFVYSGTMLVHAAGRPGTRITEDTPLSPSWAYPQSKARTEQIIAEEATDMATVYLHLAGLYDDEKAVPTLSHQIARIYERNIKSHVFSGNSDAGQAFIHVDDMLRLFECTVDRRGDIPPGKVILAGEPDTMSYGALQNQIGGLIHGEGTWETLVVPAPVAKLGAALETKSEPVVPDALDQGEKPFIRPFMIDMASDHFALDISKARELLGWSPQERIADKLPVLISALKRDPLGWYNANGITPPPWLKAAEDKALNPETLREAHEKDYRAQHRAHLWTGWANAGLGLWLLTAPPLLGHTGAWLAWSNVVAGFLLTALGFLSLSWRLHWARFAAAGLACWILFAPLVFWSESAAAYLNNTVVGMLAFAFALCFPPVPGVSPVAAQTGPTIPKGWDYSPSDWFQRLPVIMLAVVGLLISRYLTGYQLGGIAHVWEPFFPGTTLAKNGTEEIITSSVSKAWPVPDAGIGALTYALEILVGAIGSARRWRTMPWLVVLFGLMIVPLGAISIFFIVIQPIVIGTYSTLALIAAAAMIWQIPYSLDELVATYQFLRRRHRAGQPWLRVFFTGDTDEGPNETWLDDFERSPRAIVSEMVSGGMTFPWTLLASMAIGLMLMLSPLMIPWGSGAAATNHIVGALAITFSVTALAPVARLARLLNALLGTVLLFTPFVADVGWGATGFSLLCGLALISFSIPRGPVSNKYGTWDRYIR